MPLLLLALLATAPAAAAPSTVRVAAVAAPDVDAWSEAIDSMLRAGQLVARQVREDTLIGGRRHERLAQVHGGVRVFGGELVRQAGGAGTVSVFGTYYDRIDVDTTPVLSAADARRVVEGRTRPRLGPSADPELLVLPKDDGSYALTYRLRVLAHGDLRAWFVDARSGDVVLDYSDLQTDAAVGLGAGVLGDRKKISTTSQAGTYLARDQLRPPAIRTFDLKGDVSRTIDFLNGDVDLGDGDLASDDDDDWTDGAEVDGHAHAGWVYDYYYKRFGRLGLDDANIAIRSLVHTVRRQDIDFYDDDIVDLFYLNAAYFGGGVIMYGEGLPPDRTDGEGRRWNYTSGGLDVAAHELTHGVTEFSSRLTYRDESGALNEAFSDMMGTSVEFYFQPPGSGPLMADYLIGEDVITPRGLRSMENPAAYGDPDHYGLRFRGAQDNGGVHINSAIPNQAFYLAIEGGTNRTSGVAVRGVGGANRDQIEKVFYRAFTLMLPPSADFATARAATVQSARDLYGAGSAAAQAVAGAWTAVGVR